MAADMQQLIQEAEKLAAAPLEALSDDELIDMLRTAHRLHQTAMAIQAVLVQQADTLGVPLPKATTA